MSITKRPQDGVCPLPHFLLPSKYFFLLFCFFLISLPGEKEDVDFESRSSPKKRLGGLESLGWNTMSQERMLGPQP